MCLKTIAADLRRAETIGDLCKKGWEMHDDSNPRRVATGEIGIRFRSGFRAHRQVIHMPEIVLDGIGDILSGPYFTEVIAHFPVDGNQPRRIIGITAEGEEFSIAA